MDISEFLIHACGRGNKMQPAGASALFAALTAVSNLSLLDIRWVLVPPLRCLTSVVSIGA